MSRAHTAFHRAIRILHSPLVDRSDGDALALVCSLAIGTGKLEEGTRYVSIVVNRAGDCVVLRRAENYAAHMQTMQDLIQSNDKESYTGAFITLDVAFQEFDVINICLTSHPY